MPTILRIGPYRFFFYAGEVTSAVLPYKAADNQHIITSNYLR
jgi:hypothetical protein